jgi:AraC family transcriptional regulator, transcriptional activator of pobA
MSAIFDLKAFYKNINNESGEKTFEVGHFDILKIEDMVLSSNRKAKYPRRSFFKITLITGKNKINFADKSIEVNGTALIFTNPAIPYFWDRVGDDHKGFMCIFTAPFFNRFGHVSDFPILQFTDAAIVRLAGEQIPKYTALFEKMFQELQGTYLYKYDLLRNHLIEIIHEAQKIYLRPGYLDSSSNDALRITSLFAELLERQFPIELRYQVIKVKSPADFARQLNLHVNHLNKALKETTGQSTSQLINDRIISEAQTLLKNTNWTIAEIAFSLGFEEPNNFSSFFKTRAKTTPNLR